MTGPSWGTRLRRWFAGQVWREYEVIDEAVMIGPGEWRVVSVHTVGTWTKRGRR